MGSSPNSEHAFHSNEEIDVILIFMETLVGELNQPLTVISGLSELISVDHNPDDQLAEDLLVVQRQIARIEETLATVKYITRYATPPLSGTQSG